MFILDAVGWNDNGHQQSDFSLLSVTKSLSYIISLSLSGAVVTIYTIGPKRQITPFCTQKAHNHMDHTILLSTQKTSPNQLDFVIDTRVFFQGGSPVSICYVVCTD